MHKTDGRIDYIYIRDVSIFSPCGRANPDYPLGTGVAIVLVVFEGRQTRAAPPLLTKSAWLYWPVKSTPQGLEKR